MFKILAMVADDRTIDIIDVAMINDFCIIIYIIFVSH
jgi:hypothetical protein